MCRTWAFQKMVWPPASDASLPSSWSWDFRRYLKTPGQWAGRETVNEVPREREGARARDSPGHESSRRCVGDCRLHLFKYSGIPLEAWSTRCAFFHTSRRVRWSLSFSANFISPSVFSGGSDLISLSAAAAEHWTRATSAHTRKSEFSSTDILCINLSLDRRKNYFWNGSGYFRSSPGL